MAKIPDAASMERAIPRGGSRVATLDVRQAGRGLEAIGSAVTDYAERRSAVEMAEAKASYLTSKAALEGQLDEDNDYETLHDRFSTKLEQLAAEASSKVSRPEARALFVESIKPDVEFAKQQAKDVAWGKEVKVKMDDYQNQVSQLREVGLNGDVLRATEAITELTNAYVDMGYISPDQRTKLINGHKVDLAAGRIEMMPPEARVEALKQPWAKNLPSDTRAKLMREAEAEQRVGIAQSAVDGFMDRGLDAGQARAEIRSKYGHDPKLRAIMESRLDYTLAKKREDKLRQREDMVDALYSPIRFGKTSVAEISKKFPTEWHALGADGQQALFNAEVRAAEGVKTPFHLGHDEQIRAYVAQGDYKAAREYFVDHVDELSDDQMRSWSRITVEGNLTDEAKSTFTVRQRVTDRLDGAEIKDKSTRSQLYTDVDDWILEFKAENGRKPTDKELNDYVNFQLGNVSRAFWQGDQYIFEASPADATAQVISQDPALGRQALKFFEKTGRPLDPYKLHQLIRKMKSDAKTLEMVNRTVGPQ